MWNLHYFISGLDRFEVREKLWRDLEEIDLAVEKKPYTLRVPRSQRGGEVCFYFDILSFLFNLKLVDTKLNYLKILNQIIEPLVSKQWFITMEPLAEKALKAVEKGELNIMPDRFEKVCQV